MKRNRVSLQFAGLHPRTLKAYRAALDRFLKYVKRRKLSISKPPRLDKQVAEFIDQSYQEGEPLSYSGHLLSAIKRFHPALRLELPISSQYFRNWQRCYTAIGAVPAHWEMVEARMGLAHSQQQPEFALLIALGFNALLRTSEMLSLSHQHVVPHRGGKGVSLIIPGSKTSQGNPQVLLVHDDALIAYATSVLFGHMRRRCSGPTAHTAFASCLQNCYVAWASLKMIILLTPLEGVVRHGTFKLR